MKKIIILFCIILFSIILVEVFLMKNTKNNNKTSENLNTSNLYLVSNNNETENTENQEYNIEKVKMSIKEGTLTPSSATIIIIDNNEKPYVYSKWFRIDKKQNGKWNTLNDINDGYSFTAEGYSLDNTGKLETTVNWSNLYGTLDVGDYRIVKNVYDSNGKELYCSCDFTIK